jgi:ribosomal-protein-alanine N-acetyltransferase
MIVVETERLSHRPLTADDADFIRDLLNDADFLRFIGDRGVRTGEDARRYIAEGPVASYARHGFGLWLVELRGDRTPIGICGLLKRDVLPEVDLGFAFLPSFRGRGFAHESAAAVLDHAISHLGLRRVAAVVNPENSASIRLLEALGMTFDRMVRLADAAPEIKLFAIDA